MGVVSNTTRRAGYKSVDLIEAGEEHPKDAHLSEFVAECYMRRAYISGFTGSAGTAVVTKHKATHWTDGQYFLQAEKQLSSSWIRMRADNWGVPNTTEWLNDVLPPGGRIGINPGSSFFFLMMLILWMKYGKNQGQCLKINLFKCMILNFLVLMCQLSICTCIYGKLIRRRLASCNVQFSTY